MGPAMQVARISYGAGLHKVRYQTPSSIKVRVSTHPVSEDGSETRKISLFPKNEVMQLITNTLDKSFGGKDLSRFDDERSKVVVGSAPFTKSLMEQLRPESPFGAVFYDLNAGSIDELNAVAQLLERNQLVNAPLLFYGTGAQYQGFKSDYVPMELFLKVPESALERKMLDLKERWVKNTLELNRYLKPSLSSLLALDARDDYTLSHTLEVLLFCRIFGENMGLGNLELYETIIASLYHDFGKIEWPDSMLKKDGKFTDEEFAIMKGHSKGSKRIADPSLEDIKQRIRVGILAKIKYHHLYENGRGYPELEPGMGQLDEGTRCLQVADCVSAMSTSKKEKHRSYRTDEYEEKDIIADLQKNMSTDEKKGQFERKAATAAIKALKEGFSVETEIPIPSTNIFES